MIFPDMRWELKQLTVSPSGGTTHTHTDTQEITPLFQPPMTNFRFQQALH